MVCGGVTMPQDSGPVLDIDVGHQVQFSIEIQTYL